MCNSKVGKFLAYTAGVLSVLASLIVLFIFSIIFFWR